MEFRATMSGSHAAKVGTSCPRARPDAVSGLFFSGAVYSPTKVGARGVIGRDAKGGAGLQAAPSTRPKTENRDRPRELWV